MPRSYSERDVVERYVDLQAVLVGASPSLRSLARSLSLSAPAVYRYFGSIERLQKAALPSIADRLIKDAHRTEGASPRLVGLVQIQPGLMWAVSRIGGSTPAIDATIDTSSNSLAVSGGRIEGSRCASIDLPEPGGPTMSKLLTLGPR